MWLCLSCYASNKMARLHGCWIDATQDAWQIFREDIQTMLIGFSRSLMQVTWAVHDYSGFYQAGSSLGEHPNLEKGIDWQPSLFEAHNELASEVDLSFLRRC